MYDVDVNASQVSKQYRLPYVTVSFLESDPKQNARSLLSPVSDPAFHALSHGSLGFALHGSFFNHFLTSQNSSTANQNL